MVCSWQDIDLGCAVWAPHCLRQGNLIDVHYPREPIVLLTALKPVICNRALVFYKPKTNANQIALDVPRKTFQQAWDCRDVAAHGTRHTLKIWSMKVGYRIELSEMQLLHEEQSMMLLYTDVDYLKDRTTMQQHLSDYLTGSAPSDERNRIWRVCLIGYLMLLEVTWLWLMSLHKNLMILLLVDAKPRTPRPL